MQATWVRSQLGCSKGGGKGGDVGQFLRKSSPDQGCKNWYQPYVGGQDGAGPLWDV